MRKFLSMFAFALMCATGLVSCSDDDDQKDVPAPEPGQVTVTDGVFLLNSGNSANNVDGSLTYIGSDGNVIQNAFSKVNGRSLGITPNDVMVFGTKMYIVVTGENTIEVVDKNTLKSIKQIKTTDLMGTDHGTQPRHITSAGDHVYVSTFAGYVAAIDTVDFKMTDIYQVGSYPEGMAAAGSSLYVVNSDYGYGNNPSISEINLNTGKVTEHNDAMIMNPTAIAEVNGALYFLDYGQYDDSWNQTDAGVRKIAGGNITKVADATMMAVNPISGMIYTVNAPYSSEGVAVTYSVYNTATGEAKQFIDGSGIASPAAIAVDPISGDVYIASYSINPETGYADYAANGYVRQYTADGTFVKEYEAGVGPLVFAFNHNTYSVVNE